MQVPCNEVGVLVICELRNVEVRMGNLRNPRAKWRCESG